MGAASYGATRVQTAWLLAGVWALSLVASAPPCRAQASGAPTLSAEQRELARIDAQLQHEQGDSALQALRDATRAIQVSADRFANTRSADLAQADQRLAQLGQAPTSGILESPLVHQQRRALELRRAMLDGQIKQAKLLSVAAGQSDDQITEKRRAAFDAHTFQQSDSPLSPPFWSALAANVPADVQRLKRSADEAADAAARAREPRAAWAIAAALLIAVLLIAPVRIRLERKAGQGASGGEDKEDASWGSDARPNSRRGHAPRRLSESLGVTLVDTVLPGLAALSLYEGARWSGGLSAKLDDLAQVGVAAVCWGALVGALGRALVAHRHPSRRLLRISDVTAARIAVYPWIAGVITAAGWLLTRLDGLIGASLAVTATVNCMLALAYAGFATAFLLSLGRGRAATLTGLDGEAVARSSAWSLVALALSIAIAATIAAVLAGYTVLAALIGGQIIWLGMLSAIGYLVVRCIDDAFEHAFGARGWAARSLFLIFSLRASTIAQVGVLASAALRVLALLVLLSLAFAPFGRGGGAVFAQLFGFGRPFRIGSVTVSPMALAAGVLSLAAGVAMVRAVQGWLNRRFLPVTEWDSGVRNSVSTAVGYLGVTAAILWALASAGLGLQRIALVASALSLGIGFGLQQIVQNFVSGLILLVERPVKVGDWVSVGGLEGDVRSIRVRATEIQTLDRMTLIVPNSELVTKTVLNKTLGDLGGRIQLQLSISRPEQASAARDLMLAACTALSEVLSEPAPVVFIDSLANGAVNFNCFAYVANPREVYPVRSKLYFEVLDQLTTRGIAIVGAMTSVTLEPGARLQEVLAGMHVAGPSGADGEAREP